MCQGRLWASLTCREVLQNSRSSLPHQGIIVVRSSLCPQSSSAETKEGEGRGRSDRPGVTGTARAAAAACPAPAPHCLRMPEAVRGPAGQSLPQPAQTAGLMDNGCQAAAQTEEELGGMQGFGHHCKTHMHSWLPESQLYTTPKFWLL